MLLVLTVALVVLAALNAIFITWATVLDARHPSALARALGATPQQVSAGLSAAQVLPALPGAIARHPAGHRTVRGRQRRGPRDHPAGLVAARRGARHPVRGRGLTAIPARIGARRPVAEILQSETA